MTVFRSSLSSDFISVAVKFGVTCSRVGNVGETHLLARSQLTAMHSKCISYARCIIPLKAHSWNAFDSFWLISEKCAIPYPPFVGHLVQLLSYFGIGVVPMQMIYEHNELGG